MAFPEFVAFKVPDGVGGEKLMTVPDEEIHVVIKEAFDGMQTLSFEERAALGELPDTEYSFGEGGGKVRGGSVEFG